MKVRHKVHHIIEVEQNVEGNDFVIGDIHGSESAFKAVLEQLKPRDRLFIVGDLTDKGENSPAIIELIQKRKEDKEKDNEIYVVKGNHEVMFLKAVNALEKKANNEELSERDELAIGDFIMNCGEWIFDDEEIKDNISKKREVINKKNLKGDKLRREIKKLAQSIPTKLFIQSIDEIKKYMDSLPYIIRVNNKEDPFIVCHADLPMTDDEIEDKINKSKSESKYVYLNPQQIFNITWARPGEFKNTRDEFSTPVFVGHNQISANVAAVRESTSTVNLDSSAYFTDIFILVNYTEKTATQIGKQNTKMKTRDKTILDRAVENINDHLSLISLNCKIINQLKGFIPSEHNGIAKLIEISKREIPNGRKVDLIQQECEQRTSFISSISEFIKNSLFNKPKIQTTNFDNLVHRAIAEKKLNMQFVKSNSKRSINDLQELIIAQQKREALDIFNDEINRLRVPVVGRFGNTLFLSKPTRDKIAAYKKLILAIEKSDPTESLNQILTTAKRNNSITDALKKSRGFGITAVTSATVINKLKVEAAAIDPYINTMRSSPSLLKQEAKVLT